MGSAPIDEKSGGVKHRYLKRAAQKRPKFTYGVKRTCFKITNCCECQIRPPLSQTAAFVTKAAFLSFYTVASIQFHRTRHIPQRRLSIRNLVSHLAMDRSTCRWSCKLTSRQVDMFVTPQKTHLLCQPMTWVQSKSPYPFAVLRPHVFNPQSAAKVVSGCMLVTFTSDSQAISSSITVLVNKRSKTARPVAHIPGDALQRDHQRDGAVVMLSAPPGNPAITAKVVRLTVTIENVPRSLERSTYMVFLWIAYHVSASSCL